MQLSFANNRYVIKSRESKWRELREAGWVFDRINRTYTTTDWRKAVDYIEWADSDELWDDLDAKMTALEKDLAASYAIECDAEIARPHITNHNGVVLDYLPYQKAGILFAADRDDTLIADQPGLGKTIAAAGIINHLGLTSGLIVCPATLKLNWLKELNKWLVDKNLTIGVAYGGEIPDTDFVIVNYDILNRNKIELWQRYWDILVCDEAQYLASEKSARTKVIFGEYTMDWKTKKARRKKERIPIPGTNRTEMVGCVRATRRVMLTGTPMMKQPKDMWTIIRDFDPDDLGSSWDDFAMTYCDATMTPFGLQANGGSNLSELNEKLRRSFMIRRLKKQVLKDLPEKTREIIVLPPEGLKKIIKTDRDKFTDALAMLAAANEGIEYNKKTALEEVDPALILDTLTKYLPQGFQAPEISELDAGELTPGFAAYSEARRDLALSKVPMAVEHIKRLLEAGEKVIVFGIHKDVIDALRKEFPQAARIVGGLGAKKVEAEKLRFQGDKDKGIEPDPECNIILCNLKAGGVGHTLTEATVVVFVEMWSVPGDMEQCEDRCIAEGQLILTPIGWRKIEDIKVGDEVIGGSGIPRKVTDAWSQCSTKPMVEFEVDGWPVPLITTIDHRVLLSSGDWVAAGDLCPGDIVAPPMPYDSQEVPYLLFDERHRLPLVRHRNGTLFKNGRARSGPEQLRLDEETLFVLGYFIGDGFASTKSGKGRFLSFAGHKEKDEKAHFRIEAWAKSYGLGQSTIWYDNDGYGMERRFYCAEMAFWFADLFGEGARNKRIPEELMSMSLGQTAALLEGLVASDGYKRGNRIEYVTVSPLLASQVFRLAARLGYSPCVTIGSKLQWSIQWSEGESYAGRVKTVLKRARKRLKGSPSYEKVYDLTVEGDSSFVVGRSVVHNCHRIGLEHNVLIQFLVVDGTIDALTIQALVDRIAMVDEGVDGVAPDMKMGV